MFIFFWPLSCLLLSNLFILIHDLVLLSLSLLCVLCVCVVLLCSLRQGGQADHRCSQATAGEKGAGATPCCRRTATARANERTIALAKVTQQRLPLCSSAREKLLYMACEFSHKCVRKTMICDHISFSCCCCSLTQPHATHTAYGMPLRRALSGWWSVRAICQGKQGVLSGRCHTTQSHS